MTLDLQIDALDLQLSYSASSSNVSSKKVIGRKPSLQESIPFLLKRKTSVFSLLNIKAAQPAFSFYKLRQCA